MTPKEKAKELVLKFRQLPPSSPYTGVGDGEAKQCALISVNEILQHAENSYHNKDIIKGANLYWQQVKQEIENL